MPVRVLYWPHPFARKPLTLREPQSAPGLRHHVNASKTVHLRDTFNAMSPIDHRQLNLFWALSRTPHGLIDMTTPALAALLCLGQFPPLGVVLLGLVTAFAGYTAVYALNDLTDFRRDREKAAAGGFDDTENYLDGVLARHPMAKGALRYSSGLAWAAAWALAAMAGAWLLNPVCLWIFLAGCLLEIVYCRLSRVTPCVRWSTALSKTAVPWPVFLP